MIILVTPIFEFVNLRRELKRNEQAKKEIKKLVETEKEKAIKHPKYNPYVDDYSSK